MGGKEGDANAETTVQQGKKRRVQTRIAQDDVMVQSLGTFNGQYGTDA
jgi:hypothetical protein